MKDTIVVGAGIIGATIALTLRKEGRKVLLLDRNEPMAGTTPSGGHLKPSWFGGMKKVDYEPALELLDNVWGLIEEKFVVKPKGVEETVYRVDTDKVVNTKKKLVDVQQINYKNKRPIVTLSSGEELKCKLLIVATGVWVEELFPEITVTSKQGVSYRFKGKLDKPFIKTWAPYKQIVAHQQSKKEIWVGDGTAIIPNNWTKSREGQSIARCCVAVKGERMKSRAIHGLRPYITNGPKPCLLKRINKRVWAVTGAGKLGTIAAGWAARRIIDATN